MTESTELMVSQPLKAEVVFAEGGVEKVLADIYAKVGAVKTDASTVTGRAAIKSLAYKVTRSKTALDDLGKTFVADIKKRAGAIDAERRVIREKLDELADQIRSPVTAWETRISAHEEELVQIIQTTDLGGVETVSLIKSRIDLLMTWPPREWEEFQDRAGEAIANALESLNAKLATAEKREAEVAELEQLRQEKTAREQRERDERIASEAADKARIEAEQKAAREVERIAAEAETARVLAEQEKTNALAREQRAEAEKEALAIKVEEDRKAAAAKAEQDKADAVAAVQKRIADEKAAAEAATATREANVEHRRKVNAAILVAMVHAAQQDLDMANIAPEILADIATKIIIAIIKGAVPNTRIEY